MDPITLAIGAGIVAVGLAAIVAGRSVAARSSRAADPIGYLESFGGPTAGGSTSGGPTAGGALDLSGADEFARRMSQSFRLRVLVPFLRRLAAVVGRATPGDHRARVQVRLAQAGLDHRHQAEEVIAIQVVGTLVAAVLAVGLLATGAMSRTTGLLVAWLLVALGAAGPIVWLGRRADERTKAIRADLPDTLDLLAISVEAGVGLEGAMKVVTERFASPLADELARTLQEMGLGLTRRDALANLKQRSQVPELSNFVQALIQADALGMPLGRVLKVQAGEMRLRRRQWAQERAAKLPVKIMLPLVFCIFPAILVVVLGPAVSQIGDAL